MRRRDFFIWIGGVTVGSPLSARAQSLTNSRRIEMLLGYQEDEQEAQSWIATFRDSLKKNGWTEGQNIKFGYKWVGVDATLLQQGAKDIVASQPDLILSGGSPTTAALLRQTQTIPVLFVNIVDPVGQGFVASLSHPARNATGLVNLEPSMAGKWIELLKQLAPQLARVAVPFNPVSAPYADFYLNILKSTASNFGVEVAPGRVADMDALEAFIATQAREPNTGVIPMPSAFSSGHTAELAEMMARFRLPGIYPVRSFAAAGGLLAYGNDVNDNFKRAAAFADKILKGEKPSEIPVQFPTKFDLVINLKTAKTLGLTVPLALQASADEVIE
jgi:putative ABC transport system substrate-binding protein